MEIFVKIIICIVLVFFYIGWLEKDDTEWKLGSVTYRTVHEEEISSWVTWYDMGSIPCEKEVNVLSYDENSNILEGEESLYTFKACDEKIIDRVVVNRNGNISINFYDKAEECGGEVIELDKVTHEIVARGNWGSKAFAGVWCGENDRYELTEGYSCSIINLD